jgi:hypothetical protein
MSATPAKLLSAAFLVIVSVAVLVICIPVAGALPHATDPILRLTEPPVLNVTNASLENSTVLAQYPVTPTPIRIGVDYQETIPGVKGEMGAGPRFIGFSFPPATLVVVLALAIVVVASIGWLVWRKRNEKDEEQ